MSRKFTLIVAILTALIASSLVMTSPFNTAIAAPDMQTITLNTGFNHATQQVFNILTPDDYWTVIKDPVIATNESRPADTILKHPAWQPPQDESQWISYAPGGNWQLVGGPYYYQKCFCLTKALWENKVAIEQSSLDVSVRADDFFYLGLNVAPVNLGPPNNQHQLATDAAGNLGGFGGPPATWTVKGADLVKLLRPGRNCLTVRVDDLGGVITGFNLKGSLTTTGVDGIAKATKTGPQFDKCSSCVNTKTDQVPDVKYDLKRDPGVRLREEEGRPRKP
jgi:hypothetical protein